LQMGGQVQRQPGLPDPPTPRKVTSLYRSRASLTWDSSRRRPIKLVTSAGRLPFRRSGTRVVTGASVPYPPVTWTGGWGIRVS